MNKVFFILLLTVYVVAFAADEPEVHFAGGRQKYSIKDGPTVYLPKLLTKDFYRPKDVCKDAQQKKRAFALVALKTHACDCTINCNFCLEETRNITDRANTLLFDRFAAYHIRLTRHPEIAEFGKQLDVEKIEGLPGSGDIAPAWISLISEFIGESAKPGLVILDTRACKVAGFIPMDKIPIESDPEAPKVREVRAKETNELIKASLRKISPITDDLRGVIDDVRPPIDLKLAKLHPELSLKDYVLLLDEQLKKEDDSGSDFIQKQEDNKTIKKSQKP